MKEFELFIREKRYVQNVSEHTIEFYQRGFNMFAKHGFNLMTISKIQLMDCITSMREGGMSASCADAHIRAINPLLTWLHVNELTDTHYRVTRIKFEKRVMKTFTEAQIKAIINYKPKDLIEKRTHTLLLLLADTGIRKYVYAPEITWTFNPSHDIGICEAGNGRFKQRAKPNIYSK